LLILTIDRLISSYLILKTIREITERLKNCGNEGFVSGLVIDTASLTSQQIERTKTIMYPSKT
jgi:hypothetical protein